jgi:tetratricopeptide (TPR) repeat protein
MVRQLRSNRPSSHIRPDPEFARPPWTVIPMAKLNDEQSKEAWKLLNSIVAALIDRAVGKSLSRDRYERAYENIFKKKPSNKIKHDQKSAYCHLFQMSHHYLDDPPWRTLRSYDYIQRPIRALQQLGYSLGVLPTKDDPGTWIKHLRDLLTLIAEHPQAQITKNDEPSGEVKAILHTLELRGRAAIVGSRELRNQLADQIVARNRNTPGCNVAESDVSERLKQPLSAGIPPQAHNYVPVWIEIFCQLIDVRKERKDKAWLTLDHAIRRFVEDWRWTGPGKDPLHFDERSFVSLVGQGQKSGPAWREFCAALRNKRSTIQNPALVSAIAKIVRIGAAKALIVLRNVHDLASVKETIEDLFGSLEPSKVWKEFLLLVTSEQPESVAFLDTETDKITYQIADAEGPSGVRRLQSLEASIAPQGIVDKLVLDDPRAEGRHLRATVRFADSLVAKFEKDEFLERVADQEFLRRFLTSGSSNGVTRQFRWALLTGPAGAGKTRLAINFLGSAETQGFRVGFLDLKNMKESDARGWQPTRPTFVVIDYAAQSPEPVAGMLKGLIATACKTGFEYPVRLLILEREATGDWFKTIAPMDSTGASVRGFCYHENEERWDHPLTPLSSDALLAIMRGRLPDGGTELSDELLLDTLRRIDPPADGDDHQSSRPLFAAATALKIADMMESGDDTSTVIDEFKLSKLQRKDVLAWIIDRERQHFWIDGSASDRLVEKQRMRIHENLLVVATMALDIPRQRYDDECPNASREYLPNRQALDEDRFQRMAGGNPVEALNRLEPDILGEFFVLDCLNRLPVRERQSLIDAALALSGWDSAAFLVRCAIDFGEEWRGLGFLKPSIPGPAMIAFAHGVVECCRYLGEDRFEDVVAAISVMDELAVKYPDPALSEPLAYALLGKGARLCNLGRGAEAWSVYDDVVNRYGTMGELALNECVAEALYNKGLSLGAMERCDEAIATYDDLVLRYGTASELALRKWAAEALYHKGFSLAALERSDEAMAAYDDLVRRYGAASEPALRKRAAQALSHKGGILLKLGRHEEAIAVYDHFLSRYGTDGEVALGEWEMIGPALLDTGKCLNALARHDEAIAVYDNLIRYAATSADVAPITIARALFNKGGSFDALGRSDEAIAVYDDLVRRYADTAKGYMLTEVTEALLCKATALGSLGRHDEQLAVYDDFVSRYGTVTRSFDALDMEDNPWLRERVAAALLWKANALSVLGRSDDEIAAYHDLTLRFGDEELAAYDDFVSRYEKWNGSPYIPMNGLGLRSLIAQALFNKGARLGALGRSDEAITGLSPILLNTAPI